MAQFAATTTNTIRSSFCADGVRGGAHLFLVDLGNKFQVSTRYERLGSRQKIEDAIALFERALVGA